jgi:DNA-binding transcriptional LysR family regulator
VGIVASSIPGEILLPPILARVREKAPAVAFDLVVSDSQHALVALQAGDCDFALIGARSSDRRFTLSPFGADEIVLVGRAGAPWMPAGSITLSELASLPLIIRKEGSGTRAAVSRLLSRAFGSDLGDRSTVSSSEAARRCALAGIGATFISRLAVADDLASGSLRVIGVEGTPVRRRFYLARSRNSALSPAAALLVEALTGRKLAHSDRLFR